MMTSFEFSTDFMIDLSEAVGAYNKKDQFRQNLSKRVYQHTLDPLQVALTTGTGTLDLPGQMGPPRGFMWSIVRLTLSGYTVGTVTPYIDNLEPIAYPSAGTQFFSKGQLLLDSGQRLVVQATGVTSGYVQINGAADCFPRDLLPYYMGIAVI
jgi:hypothetical protein